MTKHIHADLMTQYATIAQTSSSPWEHFQYREYQDDEWSDCRGPVEFWFDHDYRLKPFRIGEYDVPEPVRKPLENDQEYYYPVISGVAFCGHIYWAGDNLDKDRLQRGLIHLTQEAAELHAKALISLTQR
ncbi:hypothetical protein [Xenorhabdus innexi]|uniref:Uncharacterized protein n=1 Tax=Xenorhabdus innexi TaxID=290109 RepID=A0A1N6MWZ4_9GAMM|nr:hypothetical protein [Xenorhabdus innexi]PHM33303.1 hypothetical protein Xinn_02560 [Xenorhabdus innexi]SIP73294.1 hypothetical protein XIS1_1800017 [Xenorhabdus innexi]